MSWIFIALSAYLILAFANLLDKFLVDQVVKSSRAYAFIVCVFGLLVFLLAPWFLSWPGWGLFFGDLMAGAIFALAIWFLFEALYRGEASRILILVGGLTPVFSILFSLLFFKEHFSAWQFLGFLFLLIGILIVAFLPVQRSYASRVFNKLRLTQEIKIGGFGFAVLAALAYSTYFLSTKFLYSTQPFLSVFMWNRLGAALLVILFLISKSERRIIISQFYKSASRRNQVLVFFNQLLGSLGFLLQNYAIFLGSVALVNALQGAQYAFLLIIGTGLALLSPKLLKETFSWPVFFKKLSAVVIIGLGLYCIIN
ncbi:MAG: DMT family transporter [Patescibacteria group bacterium]